MAKFSRISSGQGPNQGNKIKAVAVSQPNAEQLPPTFCLRYMRKGFDLTECDAEEQASFAQTLYNLSQLTWAQIKQADRHGMGSEKISRDSIKGDSVDSIKEDAVLLALRFSGKKAMVGYRGEDGILFHIIWMDREFKLYKH